LNQAAFFRAGLLKKIAGAVVAPDLAISFKLGPK
jgi:hypothetical protein